MTWPPPRGAQTRENADAGLALPPWSSGDRPTTGEGKRVRATDPFFGCALPVQGLLRKRGKGGAPGGMRGGPFFGDGGAPHFLEDGGARHSGGKGQGDVSPSRCSVG